MKTCRALTLVASAAFILVSTANVLTADWSPHAAARYLDQRQKEWFEWKGSWIDFVPTLVPSQRVRFRTSR